MTTVSEDDVLIGPNDTIIVLHEDGTCEVSFPEIDDEAAVPEHVIAGAAIMYALEDEELSEMIYENFAIQCEEYAYMNAANDN